MTGMNKYSRVWFGRSGWADHGDAEAVIEEDVRGQRDGAQEQDGECRTACADDYRDGRHEPGAPIDGEVAESQKAWISQSLLGERCTRMKLHAAQGPDQSWRHFVQFASVIAESL